MIAKIVGRLTLFFLRVAAQFKLYTSPYNGKPGAVRWVAVRVVDWDLDQ